MKLSIFRYNLYRLLKRVALGPLGGGALGSNLCRTLVEGRAAPTVASHVSDCRKIASACVQSYPFPDDFPPEFPRETAFDAKFVYRLRDVVVVPKTGLAWFPGGPMLQESAGSLPRLFQKRIAATLQRPVPLAEQGPVVAFPSFSYYHVLFDVLANVLHSLSFVPSAKILLPARHPRFVKSILDFLGIPKERRVLAEGPVLVKDLVFSPIWVNGGFIPPVDLAMLRSAILPRIGPGEATSGDIYISRSLSRNRPLANEPEIEEALRKRGFSIVHFETIPFAEQMRLVSGATRIVAPHGAGLANLVAARPGTEVTEILSRNWFNTCYAKLAMQLGCGYHFVESLLPNGATPGKKAAPLPHVCVENLLASVSFSSPSVSGIVTTADNSGNKTST